MSEAIVVGVDGSATAQRAAQKARDLAERMQAPLHVVCAYTKEGIAHVKSGTDEWVISAADPARQTAEAAAAELADSHVEVRSAAEHGKPSEALLAYAERVGAQMIVVGNRGMRGMTRMLGSVANSVSHSASCDVYIVNTTDG